MPKMIVSIDGVVIKNAECVNKTYPQFFDDLKKVVTPAAT